MDQSECRKLRWLQVAQMNVLQPLINKNALNERSAAVLQQKDRNERLMAILYGPIRLQEIEVVANAENERSATT
jgi:hypothetical protein